ncbi:MAG TPA: U32 family peptidase, partial [Desulfobacterales bacterium]|nr:U32 family peptidase [Desulfobacterales bacterium]
ELARLGVRALKIEGRMKSPEYAAAAVRLYRAVIDRGEALDDEEYARLARAAQTAFSREPTTGWLRSSSGSRLIDTRFPGHRGARLGNVTGTTRGEGRAGSWIQFTLDADLSLRDGLAVMSDDGTEQHAFSVQEIRQVRRLVRFARAGETVEVLLPPEVPPPRTGAEVRHLSSRFQDLPEPREGSVAPYRAPMTVEAVLAGAPGGEATIALAAHRPVEARVEEAVTLEPAARPRPFAAILGPLLGESGDSFFTATTTAFENRTGLADDRIFVPPSGLKRVKNRFYARLDEAFRASVASRAEAVGRGPDETVRAPARLDVDVLASFVDRTALSPRGCDPLPFARREADGSIDAGGLAVVAGFTAVPLPPIMLDTGPWISALRELVESVPSARFVFGLNNVSHLAVADALAGQGTAWFFADVFLYTANRWTTAFLASRVPRLLFAYRWIEEAAVAAGVAGYDGSRWAASSVVPVVTVAPGFRAPLFTSRGCFAKHVLNGGACFDDCPREFRVPLRQGGRRFDMVVADCVTYLFGAEG